MPILKPVLLCRSDERKKKDDTIVSITEEKFLADLKNCNYGSAKMTANCIWRRGRKP